MPSRPGGQAGRTRKRPKRPPGSGGPGQANLKSALPGGGLRLATGSAAAEPRSWIEREPAAVWPMLAGQFMICVDSGRPGIGLGLSDSEPDSEGRLGWPWPLTRRTGTEQDSDVSESDRAGALHTVDRDRGRTYDRAVKPSSGRSEAGPVATPVFGDGCCGGTPGCPHQSRAAASAVKARRPGWADSEATKATTGAETPATLTWTMTQT